VANQIEKLETPSLQMNEEWGLLFSGCGDGNVAGGEILSFSKIGVKPN
jgi:hypothetical protein